MRGAERYTVASKVGYFGGTKNPPGTVAMLPPGLASLQIIDWIRSVPAGRRDLVNIPPGYGD